MAENEQNRRHFITRLDVDQAARSGSPVSLGPRDVITDEAAQRARDLNVTVSSTARPAAAAHATGSAPAATTGAPTDQPDPALRPLVREAVIAELRTEPARLDDALDKVFGTSER